MTITELQQQLFQSIKSKIPENLSAAEEIAKILDISPDSAYRRIRGEKPISLDELYLLCTHYHISMDQLLNIQTDAFMFYGKNVDAENFRFDEYLTNTLQNMAYVNTFKEKEIYCMWKDLPIFHHFHFRELAAFKYYFWMRTILHLPQFARRKFNFDEYPDEVFELGKKILDLYNQVPSVEIWSIETLNSTMRQIEYSRYSQMFKSDEDILKVYEALEKLIAHLAKQADEGYKFNYNDTSRTRIGSFSMYFNEVIIGDNSTLVILDGKKTVYLVHNVINFMITRDVRFCEYTYNSIQNLMQKSTLISSSGEKERSKFFKSFHDRIAKKKESLEV